MSPFQVGDRVVCINANTQPMDPIPGYQYFPDVDGLTEGQIYTIRWIGPEPLCTALTVQLAEINRGTPREGYQPGFSINRFRPLVSDHTALWESWLVPVKAGKLTGVDA